MNDAEIFKHWSIRAVAVCLATPILQSHIPSDVAVRVRTVDDEALAWLENYISPERTTLEFDWTDCWFVGALDPDLAAYCLLPHLIKFYHWVEGQFDNDFT